MKRTNTAVWLEKYQRWQIKVQKDSVRKTFTCPAPGRNGQRECNKKADSWLDDGIVNSKTKTDVFFDAWIKELKDVTSQSYWGQYESYGKNWIKPRIGKVNIGDISEQHLQSVINAAYKKGLSKKSLNNIKVCMTAFIKHARKQKATTLFVENLTVPRSAKVGERTILQPNDIKVLFEKDNTVRYGKEIYEMYINAFRFEVATGLRPGEVLGLKWSDIDGSVARIRRSENRLNEITKGKNNNAKRTFQLTPLTLAIMQNQKAKFDELGIKSDYIFSDEYGDIVKQGSYYTKWIKYRDYAGISKASPYELRHTFVSIVKRLPEGLLKPLIGHSKDMDSYGTYSHEVEGDMEATAELVQDIFAKILKPE